MRVIWTGRNEEDGIAVQSETSMSEEGGQRGRPRGRGRGRGRGEGEGRGRGRGRANERELGRVTILDPADQVNGISNLQYTYIYYPSNNMHTATPRGQPQLKN